MIGLLFTTFESDGSIRENLAFNDIPLKIGQYPIRGGYRNLTDGLVGSDFVVLEEDGDVLGAVYEPEKESEGVMKITGFDSFSNEIEGTFSFVQFRLKSSKTVYPESIVFKNGSFKMKFF